MIYWEYCCFHKQLPYVDYGHLPPLRRLGYRIPHGHLTDQVAVRIVSIRTNVSS